MTAEDPIATLMASLAVPPAQVTVTATLPPQDETRPLLSVLPVDDQPFRMLQTLGEGGMGVVHLAEQRSLRRHVAVKALHHSSDPEARSALVQEALVVGALQHPNIVPVYTLDSDSAGAPLLVMKRIEGVSWEQLLCHPELIPESTELEWHLRILVQICNALAFAHSLGVIHRDLKPANVMIGSFGEVYLVDWGIAVSVQETHHAFAPVLNDRNRVAGTPVYMAPEMFSAAAGDIGAHTDVYLVGALLYELLAGEPPHMAQELQQVLQSVLNSSRPVFPPDCPPELAAIASRAMEAEPSERFGSVAELREALEQYLDHRGAIALAEAARHAGEELVELLESGAEHDREVEQLSSSLRFGYRQALEQWPDSRTALDDFQRALERVATMYLERRNPGAALTYLVDLPSPRPALEAQAEELLSELQSEREHFEGLKRIEQDLDLDTAWSSRTMFVVAMIVIWTGGTLWAHFTGAGYAERSGVEQLIVAARTSGLGLLVMFVFRKRLLANLANSRLMELLVTGLLVVMIIRFLGWTHGWSAAELVGAEVSSMLLICVTVGLIARDLWIVAAGALYLVTIAATILLPESFLLVMASNNIIYVGTVAMRWRPTERLVSTGDRSG